MLLKFGKKSHSPTTRNTETDNVSVGGYEVDEIGTNSSSNEGTAIKKKITRFEMHQALKLQRGEISQRSVYNPLDLFSESKERVHKAIKNLFTTPQNNFRVFLNGSLTLGGLGGGAESSDVCMAKVLEDELHSVIQAGDGQCTKNLFTLVTEAVHKSGVLNQLLEIQKLDASLDESLRVVKDYLIAATAKDCSLMLCFKPRNENDSDSGSSYNTVYLESTKQAFDYKVHFIDLDLKRLNKVEDYYELDKNIVSCYKQMNKIDDGRNEDAKLQGPEVANLQGSEVTNLQGPKVANLQGPEVAY
ncbi:inositol-pentakisphosphate 2-kinase-like [Vicia villosa]|uniref:inositol-pentakisphosphate 2-kinase-like n=1 Tax=Vicia villosa TaxID=3911 RepID=UPI00273B7B9E|nr:inositol-pentakisphosphate 2-kinase-like [Vicia villosa]